MTEKENHRHDEHEKDKNFVALIYKMKAKFWLCKDTPDNFLYAIETVRKHRDD